MRDNQPDLLPTPAKGQLWSPGEGAVCEVRTAWRMRDNAGVVVLWRAGGEGRRALYSLADFQAHFAPLQPDLLEAGPRDAGRH